MFKLRTLSKTLKTLSDHFPVILLTGPRQVGKTTLLEFCKEKGRGYVTLDDLEQRAIAKSDPVLFLKMHKAPVIIDEVQYAPELFGAIKMICDKEKKQGLYWLTGSQKFHLMKGIQETLAGRVAIVDMLGMSQAEIHGDAMTAEPFLPTSKWIENRRIQNPQPKSLMGIYEEIWRGSFPKLIADPKMPRDAFFQSYLQTYVTRDVQDFIHISDQLAYHRFLKAIAARTGQLVNYQDLSRDVDIDPKTAKSWLSVLEASGLVFLLQPYFTNITKRLVKTPKLYFLDTGLCSYLTQWSTPQALASGSMSGAILETFVFTEILKSWWFQAKRPPIYFYRDRDGHEVDFIIEQDGMLFPIEVKKTAAPRNFANKNFKVLNSLDKKMGHAGIVCFVDTAYPITSDVDAIPINWI
jgi:predicted AAA+ superfamily ATPase